MDEKLIVNAMTASISNFKCYTKKHKAKRGISYIIKYYIWLAIMVFFAPKRNIMSKRMVCAISTLNKKQLLRYADNDELFCFSKLNSSVAGIRKNLSVFSPYRISTRIGMLVQGVKLYYRHRTELHGYMHHVLEYYVIASYLYEFKPKEIFSPNTYERYCTLLSYLGHGLGIRLVGIQEGMIINIHAPAKVYCDEMHIFDQFEENIFREIILNADCEYICEGFTSTLNWGEFASGGKITIAIASQDWLTDKTIWLASELISKLDYNRFAFVIYPHYREKLAQYAGFLKQHPDCQVETKLRHRNIDLLITYYSTIVFDFWSVNAQLPVVCMHIPGFEPSYYKRSEVSVCCAVDEMVKIIKDMFK